MRCFDPPRSMRRRLCGLAVLPVLLSIPAHAGAAGRASLEIAPGAAAPGVSARDATAVARYWTPARMRGARPLDQVLDPDAGSRAGPGDQQASASFAAVPDTTQPPFTAVGRVFLKVGRF